MSKLRQIARNPFFPFSHFFYAGWLNWIPDKTALKLWYRSIFGKKLDLNNPRSYNEKMQWLKLYDRNPIYPTIVNKNTVKEYVSERIGVEHIIPTLAVYNSTKEIDLATLPNQFVLKCTHDSGGIAICRDKKTFDFETAKMKLEKSLKHNYFFDGREWPYKLVPHQIIAEKYMEDEENEGLKDYKFFCFNGNVKCLYVSEDSHTPDQKIQFYDSDFVPMDCKRKDYLQFDKLPTKPEQFEKMKELASLLSQGFPHIRVDLYEIKGQVYFGEMTLYTSSGFIPFVNKDDDEKLGMWLNLPNKMSNI